MAKNSLNAREAAKGGKRSKIEERSDRQQERSQVLMRLWERYGYPWDR